MNIFGLRGTSRGAGTVVSALVAVSLGATVAPASSTASTASIATSLQGDSTGPSVTLVRTIRTTPLQGSSVSMRDHEGAAYVPRDNSLWLADDERRRLYEVNARTGALRRMVTAKMLAQAKRFRGTRTAGRARTRDLEGLAYDARTDRLYAFNGSDCAPSTASCWWPSRPSAILLTRVGGRLRPTSFQPLPPKTQVTGAAWHPGRGKLFVVTDSALRRYLYRRNNLGPALPLPSPKPVLGATFTYNGRAILVTHGDSASVSRLSWPGRSLRWTTGLSRVGIRDARGVVLVGRRLFVSDGYDDRRTGSPLSYAVFVLRLR